MTHLPILPVLIPLAAAILSLLVHRAGLAAARAVSLTAVLALVVVAAWGLMLADDGAFRVYRLGDWPAPFGIVLVLDRLSAMMTALTAALALPALLYAIAGADAAGRHFHAVFLIQLAGINGAFLAGDLFNLFVFFEILLLASYILLAHGGGLERARAGLAYVVLNLAGSALFLVALALLYGTLGTLNLADVAAMLPRVPAGDQALVRTAAVLLVAVFALKAALLPLSFWLPHVYSAASPPVAALFALLTKVGIAALLRVSVIAFAAAPFTASLLSPWLLVLALATVALGTAGALAAAHFAGVAANLVLVSAGTLLAAISMGGTQSAAAALYYIPHTTLITGGLFLVAGAIAGQRGDFTDSIRKGPSLHSRVGLGAVFLVLAVAVSGVPPLSGFLGKIMLLQSVAGSASGWWFWGVLLVSGLTVALVLARAASAFFWEPGRPDLAAAAKMPRGERLARGPVIALALLAAASPALTLAAAPVAAYARAAAAQLHDRAGYISAVLGAKPKIQRERRP